MSLDQIIQSVLLGSQAVNNLNQTLSNATNLILPANITSFSVGGRVMGSTVVAGTATFTVVFATTASFTTVSAGTASFSTLGFTTAINHALAFNSLPSAGVTGHRAFISNCNVTAFWSVAAGGGAFAVPVFDDGVTWRVG